LSKEESGAFQYAASPPNALGEARRVLGPSGTIVIANWGQPQDWEAAAFGFVADDEIAHIPTVTLPHGEIFQQSVFRLEIEAPNASSLQF